MDPADSGAALLATTSGRAPAELEAAFEAGLRAVATGDAESVEIPLRLIRAALESGDAVDAASRQQFLQKSIAIAMHTTALGIFVAIPTLFTHAVLQSKINSIISDIDQYSVKLINLLSASQKTGRPVGSIDEDAAGAND